MFFRMLYDDKLAQASYLIGCQAAGEAVVIDPERDVDRYIELAEREGLKIAAITETHIHADFLSGAREMAERTGAKLYLSDEGDADWKYQWVNKKQGGGSYNYRFLNDGDTFKIGNIELKVVHTPGHTPEHICFMVTDHGGASEPMGIVTGDFVFVGDVGRPDLLETAAGQVGAKEQSARVLYQSLQRFLQFSDYMQLWPGHGAGSACGKALGAVPQSTVGYEKRFNPAVNDAAAGEESFVQSILYGQPEPPMYFSRMKKENKEGPAVLGKIPSPKAVDIETITKARKENAAVLDTRAWEQYAEGHLAGALHAPMENSFPTVAGSYVGAGTPIYLVVEGGRVKEAVTDLIRIGLDNVDGYATPETLAQYAKKGGALQTTRYFNINKLKNKLLEDNALVLDVRRADEFEAGHLAGAENIAHTRLWLRLDEVPKDCPIYVHCRTSNRSAYAAGLLDSMGFNVTLLTEGYEAWLQAGGEVVVEKPEYV